MGFRIKLFFKSRFVIHLINNVKLSLWDLITLSMMSNCRDFRLNYFLNPGSLYTLSIMSNYHYGDFGLNYFGIFYGIKF